MKCYLEIFVTSFEGDEHIRYSRMVIDISDDASNPDDIVQELVNPPLDNMPKLSGSRYISHSTSWRYEYDGSIYLTYLVFSEGADFSRSTSEILPVHDMIVPRGGAPERPRPADIHEKYIISHGMRHLAYLVDDTDGIYQSMLSSKSLLLFGKVGLSLAGKI
jgi:hypothetical protein